MKLFCAFVLIITGNLQAMQSAIPYQDQPTNQDYFKELRMQLYEHHQRHPGLLKGAGLLFVSVAIYQPTLMAGSAIVSSLAALFVYSQGRNEDMQNRKKDKDLISYALFANGPQELMERECKQDEYKECTIASLKKQNTSYLIYVLNQYALHSSSDKSKKIILNNYLAALNALKKNHADIFIALEYFTQKKPANSFALSWLKKNMAR